MMTEKQFIESQKECASMLGMSLSEYQNYCKNVKVPKHEEKEKKLKGNTSSFINYLGLDNNILKKESNSCNLLLFVI